MLRAFLYAMVLGTSTAFTGPGRIDIHHHFFPTATVPELAIEPDAQITVPIETLDDHIPFMDALGIQTAILMPTIDKTWGIDLTPAQFLDLCQRALEAALDAVASNPLRWGSSVMIPLPHVAESLRFLDSLKNRTLQPDAFALASAMGNRYLGDAAFDPVWARLDAMNATVFVHPSNTVMPPNLTFAPPVEEYPFDTTRSLLSLLVAGVFTRFPHINFIFAHNGGAFPFLADRFHFQHLAPVVAAANDDATIRAVLARANVFFDTAQSAPLQWAVTLGLGVPVDHVLFGTDWPYTADAGANDFARLGDEAPLRSGCFAPAQMVGVRRAFALRKLFPRLRAEFVRAFGEAAVVLVDADVAASENCTVRPME